MRHRSQPPRWLLLPRPTTPPPSKTEVAAARGAVALAEGDAATALLLLRNETLLDEVSTAGDTKPNVDTVTKTETTVCGSAVRKTRLHVEVTQ
jgi:hypothetical protein